MSTQQARVVLVVVALIGLALALTLADARHDLDCHLAGGTSQHAAGTASCVGGTR